MFRTTTEYDASNADDYDELWETEWCEIPDVPYIVKFKFNEDSYIILVTNLKEIYGEKLTATEAKERFSILNPHAEMKPGVLMKSIKVSCETFLSRVTYDPRCVQQCTPNPQEIIMHLAFIVSEVVVTFEIKPQILPSEKLRTHLIASTVLRTSLLCRANEESRNGKNACSEKLRLLDECDSILKKKSQIPEEKLLNTFMDVQRTVKKCIADYLIVKNEYIGLQKIIPSERKEERKEKKQGKKASSNVPQLSEMSVTLVKREVEDSSIDKNNPLTADNNPSSENYYDPSLQSEKDTGLGEMQSKQKKRKILKF